MGPELLYKVPGFVIYPPPQHRYAQLCDGGVRCKLETVSRHHHPVVVTLLLDLLGTNTRACMIYQPELLVQ